MTKFVRYIANFICFFFINVNLNASQISNEYKNELLGSLYADYNNDFLSWKKLPTFEDYADPSSLYLNQIIIGEKLNLSDLNNNFTLLLIDKLERLKNDDCSLLEIDSANYIFEESLAKSINFWMKYFYVFLKNIHKECQKFFLKCFKVHLKQLSNFFPIRVIFLKI